MHIKTILNKRYPLKRFVYGKCHFNEESDSLIVEVRPRKNSKPRCHRCGKCAAGYDTQPVRLFQFVPLWGMRVFFAYAMRRVNCPTCGVVVEKIPWSEGKRQSCWIFLAFLASWAQDLPWKRVGERFRTSWQTVYQAVHWVVSYGLEHRELEDVTAIGVDEVQYKKGHQYLTVVYQIDNHLRRLLWVGKDRTQNTLTNFFTDMETKCSGFCENIQFVCSDMWKPYLHVINTEVPHAMHVLDRFHVQGKFSEALDQVRRQEVARLKAEGKHPVLAKARWCFLKNPKNLTEKQKGHLNELLKMNLRSVKAYLLAQEFEHFWIYKHQAWARKFLNHWCWRAMHSRIQPMKAVAKTLRHHNELILNWFRAKKEINNGITEGLNLNVKLAFRKARGFRSDEALQTALFHQLGKLPQPPFPYRLW